MGKTITRPRQRLITVRPQPQPRLAPAPSGAVEGHLRTVAPEDLVDVRRVLNGCYDAPTLSFPVPPSILDVGAHVGAASRWFLDRFPGCSIQAYEPHPSTADALAENLRDAGWSVDVHPLAVVGIDWPDPKPLLLDGRRSQWHRSLYPLDEQVTSGTRIATLLATELPEADILKLATNGCELDILDAYPYLKKLRAVMLRCTRPADQRPIAERMRASGLSLVREGAPEMVFVRKQL
jgi:FkbM family methyltransferase